jgi:hypothetical protein
VNRRLRSPAPNAAMMPGDDHRRRLEELAAEYLTIHELQVLFRCTAPTLQQWHVRGRLRMVRRPSGSGWLAARTEITRMLTDGTGLTPERAGELIDTARAVAAETPQNNKRRPVL